MHMPRPRTKQSAGEMAVSLSVGSPAGWCVSMTALRCGSPIAVDVARIIERTCCHRRYTFDIVHRTGFADRIWIGHWFDVSGEYRTYAMAYPDSMTAEQVVDRARESIDKMIPTKLLNRDEV